MSIAPIKIAYLTAGAAGMYCGSCMHDNTLAKGLLKLGCDVQLIPLYTPIRTDEQSMALGEVFFGGINVFLQQKFPPLRYAPRWLNWLLDRPGLLRFADRLGIKTTAKDLGALAVSILKGDQGFQRSEVERLSRWLSGEAKPDVLIFTNMLVAGCVPAIKRRLNVPVLVTLQGDDIFLDDLPEPYQSQALAEIRGLLPHIDGFIVNSRYYADAMSARLGADRERFHIVPLGIDTADFRDLDASTAKETSSRPPTIGYLARLAPEKGLHVLGRAMEYLHRDLGRSDIHLRIAGWLGKQHRPYVDEVFAKLRAAGLKDRFEYVGEVDRRGKLDFLQSIDLLTVPTIYREPKGLFVLESLAAGVPVVQPNHGAFPELLAATAGGVLVPPNDPLALAQACLQMFDSPDARSTLGAQSRRVVHGEFNAEKTAERTLAVVRQFVPR